MGRRVPRQENWQPACQAGRARRRGPQVEGLEGRDAAEGVGDRRAAVAADVVPPAGGGGGAGGRAGRNQTGNRGNQE